MARRVLRFVTGNAGKVREAAHALEPIGVKVEQAHVPVIEIQADTLAEVAASKLEAARRSVDPPFFLDDSGLFVEALKGFPGVYSAYALRTIGVAGLLKLLDGVEERGAHFEAVVAYQPEEGAARFYRGESRGVVARKASDGGRGFGFDPIFVPAGERATFAELPLDRKNRLSHRGIALAKLAADLAEAAP